MKLYVWTPQEYGGLYYWVMAEEEHEARRAIEAYRLTPEGNGGWPYWPEQFDLEIYEANQVGSCEYT